MSLFLFLCFFVHYAPTLLATPIIGGDIVMQHHFKFHVSIHEINLETHEHKYFCGGTIVHKIYILTAAHCYMDKKWGFIYGIKKPPQIKIIAGTNQRDGTGIERLVAQLFIPKTFDLKPDHYADVAIAKLNSNIDVADSRVSIAPLGFLHPNEEVNKRAEFCGFGYYELERGSDGIYHPIEHVSSINRFLSITMVGRENCPDFPFVICGRNTENGEIKTACKGDSGAGLLYGTDIVGVLSHGEPDCNSNADTIKFTRLSEFRQYVERAMNEHADHSGLYVVDEHTELYGSPPHGAGPSHSPGSSPPQNPPRQGGRWALPTWFPTSWTK